MIEVEHLTKDYVPWSRSATCRSRWIGTGGGVRRPERRRQEHHVAHPGRLSRRHVGTSQGGRTRRATESLAARRVLGYCRKLAALSGAPACASTLRAEPAQASARRATPGRQSCLALSRAKTCGHARPAPVARVPAARGLADALPLAPLYDPGRAHRRLDRTRSRDAGAHPGLGRAHTILLSTHILSEARSPATGHRIDRGRVVAGGHARRTGRLAARLARPVGGGRSGAAGGGHAWGRAGRGIGQRASRGGPHRARVGLTESVDPVRCWNPPWLGCRAGALACAKCDPHAPGWKTYSTS